jgi:hypothetical protein
MPLSSPTPPIHIHINKIYFNVVYHRYMDVQRENRITHKIQYNTPQNNLRVIMFVFMWWKIIEVPRLDNPTTIKHNTNITLN